MTTGLTIDRKPPSGWMERLRSDPADNTPLYLQLSQKLTAAIREGYLKPGEALPAERPFSEALQVSRITVRKAISLLINNGLLRSQQGSGNFVTGMVEEPLSTLSSFTEDMKARGRKPASLWLEKSLSNATPEEAMLLGLRPGETVARIARLRLADDEPLALQRAVLPQWAVSDLEAVGTSLYTYLRERNLKPVRALQHLRAQPLPRDAAEQLGLPPGGAALYIVRVSYLPDGRPIELTRSYYRGDRYDFVAELRIQEDH